MAKFIKFTDVKPMEIVNNEFPMIDEIIISTDQITSVAKAGDDYRLNTKCFLTEYDKLNIRVIPYTQSAYISKKDYENAKEILMEL